jgi:hypothetical protein
MLYMAVSFNDPLVQLGLFICAYIIVTGVCSYFGYSSDQYGIYMTFTAFMLSVIMILPDPINFGDTFNTIIEPLTGVTSTPDRSLFTDAASVTSRGATQVANSVSNANKQVNAAASATATTNLITSIASVFTSGLNNIIRNNKVSPNEIVNSKSLSSKLASDIQINRLEGAQDPVASTNYTKTQFKNDKDGSIEL